MKYINADEQERIMLKNEMIETNDWVEVVRCKDCKYYNSSLNCPFIKNRFVYDNDFCSEGERRTE